MNPVAAVACRGVSKTWNPDSPSSLLALDDLSFDVARGEFVVLLGPSGCGKSTLLYMIAGLESVSSGTIACDGIPVAGPSPERGMIFQDASLYPWLTLSDNVTFGLGLRGMSPANRRDVASKLLRKVGLGDMLDKRPDELSGGMRQRVNIAQALAVEPDILLMDEPFASLDAQTREIMQAELMRIWQETRKTVVLITHQIDEAVFLSDRVFVFTARPGRLKAEIAVDLPRPRSLAMKRTAEFAQYLDRIWRLIEEEVREGMRREEQTISAQHTRSAAS